MEKSLYKFHARSKAQLLSRQLIGDIAPTRLTDAIKHTASKCHPHISGDIVCHRIFTAEKGIHADFLSIIIIAKGMTDLIRYLCI